MENTFDLLNKNRDQFQSIVLQHANALSEAEWSFLRELAFNKRRWSIPYGDVTHDIPRGKLIAEATAYESISIDEILIPAFKANALEIGMIEQNPVYYIKGKGIYMWGPDRTSPNTINVWLTHPAYPPGW